YDRLSVDPPSGSTAGGTFVRIRGADTSFTADDAVFIGDEPLLEPTFVSATLITGRTPSHAPGPKTVRVEGLAETVTAPEAFTYFDSADPINGGFGGGPIQGEVNIVVLDAYTDEPVADAYVLMGADASSPYQAVTDGTGRVTFSAPGLTGPQMITVAAVDYERVSVIAFDARDVTLFLTPFVPPNPGTIPGQSWSLVNGLVTFGGVEFGQGCDFSQMVPEPVEGETRVIKVYQTVGDYDYTTSTPGEGGTIYEGTECITGYGYWIYARPGSYAVYALAGIEEDATGAFTPHALGIARNLLSGPDQTLNDVNITIDFPLDRDISFDLSEAPPLDPAMGPVGYSVSVFIDLGGDGFIVRSDTKRSVTETIDPVLVDRLPHLTRGLSDGTYTAFIEAHNNGSYPYSKVYLSPVQPSSNPVLVDTWLGIPVAVDPEEGGEPTTNRMIWTADGDEPTFNLVVIRTFPDGDPYWQLLVNGAVDQFVLPDLYGLGPGLDGHPAGMMYWHIIPITVLGMDFNDFSYRYFNDRYWSATAGDGFTFSFPDAQ
ncbi:IPT/TIG domain-containing protein, partial [Myxococcota bacterium]